MQQLNIKLRINKELPELNALPRCLLLDYGILCKVTTQNFWTKLELKCLENDFEFTKKLLLAEMKKRLSGLKLPIEWNITEDHSGSWSDTNLLANITQHTNDTFMEFNPKTTAKYENNTMQDESTNMPKHYVKNDTESAEQTCEKSQPKYSDHRGDALDTIGRNDLTMLDSSTDDQKIVLISYQGRGITFEISKYKSLKKLYQGTQKEFPVELKINSLFCLVENEKFYITSINDFKSGQIYYVESDENAHFNNMEGFYNRLHKYLAREEVARIYHCFELESIHFETLRMLDSQKLTDMGINQIGLQDFILYVVKYN
ncbi:hypothetical protein HDV01_002851 [Terramyces sp. JEL0728]|nr:hypothetical protein HDV01_002851 [Terramyces sp. JEL0728]